MGRDGLLIGEVAARSGVSRKALRLYEAAGILPAPHRTAAGYRVYGSEALAVLQFVKEAKQTGFSLEEIKEIIAIRRSGRVPCPHVRDLVRRKAVALDKMLADLTNLRDRLRGLLGSWRSQGRGRAVVCPHIEQPNQPKKRR